MAVVNGIGRIGFMKGGKAALWKDEEMADTFTREAVAFIEREKAHPFYLYFATHDIHVPRVPHPRFATATTMGARGNAIAEFDWEVGEILAALDRNGLAENTLVLLTSDNGPVLDDGYADQANELRGTHQPAGPLRAGKYSLFEGGTRVPWIVRYPARVKPGVSGALISQIDLPATFAALAGAPAPATPWIDSRNALPALLGEDRAGRRAHHRALRPDRGAAGRLALSPARAGAGRAGAVEPRRVPAARRPVQFEGRHRRVAQPRGRPAGAGAGALRHHQSRARRVAAPRGG